MCLRCLPWNSRDQGDGYQRDRAISKQLKKDKQQHSRTIPVLLLGAAECGKSTVLKQMIRKYSPQEFENRRMQSVHTGRYNLAVATLQLLGARDTLGLRGSHSENQDEREFRDKVFFLEAGNNKVSVNISMEIRVSTMFDELAPTIKRIWADESVKSALARKSEFYMVDCGEHFYSRIDSLADENYKPTDEDVLMCRVDTTGMVEITFADKLARDSVYFKITDVGGQRSERKMWSTVLANSTTALIYVFSLSDYNLSLAETGRGNRMDENTRLFSTIINTHFRSQTIVVFLNKKDIFEKKLKHVPLTVCYSNFPAENRDPEEAMSFIQSQILSRDQQEPGVRTIRFHRTQASHPANFSVVVDAVLDDIQAENMRQAGLL